MSWLTGPLRFRSFWPRTTWKWSPHPPYSSDLVPLWIFPLPQAEVPDEVSKIRHHWRDSRGIAVGTWHNSKKGLPGMLPSMAEMLGPLYSCKRGVLWRWWRNLTSKVSKLLFTSTVLELLDTPLYVSQAHPFPFKKSETFTTDMHSHSKCNKYCCTLNRFSPSEPTFAFVAA